VLKADEIDTLISWLPNFSRLVEDVATLYLWTCTRGSKILEMEVCEIAEEEDGLWWTVPKAKTNNVQREQATDMRVPLIGRAEVIVRRRMDLVKEVYIFPSGGEAATSSKRQLVRWSGCTSRMQRLGLSTSGQDFQCHTGQYTTCGELGALS
jgi:integrase